MIAIRLLSVAGKAPASEVKAWFSDAGGDIGRGSQCTLVLPDPERLTSRRHLRVAFRSGQATLQLISTNLIVELDGVPLIPGAETALRPGARVRIGPFELQVETVDAKAPAADDSLALLRPTTSGPSVFRDLLRPAEPVPALREVDLLVGDPTGVDARTPPLAPMAASVSEPVDGEAMFAALYAGLGLPTPATPPGSTLGQMQLVGALLRACVSGALGLLAARAIAKRELGASATQLQVRKNNPLKYSPDVETALVQLLAPPQRGFVLPLDAVHDAFKDLRAHEVALLAGMRASLAAVLDHFDPAALEARLADKSLWDNMLAGSRKAKLWERYAEQYAAIAREVDENFDRIFASAFAEAYEAQRNRLRDVDEP